MRLVRCTSAPSAREPCSRRLSRPLSGSRSAGAGGQARPAFGRPVGDGRGRPAERTGWVTTSVGWLTVSQVSAGALVAASGIAAIVVAVEEVPRGCRAWAVGVLGMAAGFGGGVPLLLLPLAGTGPGGWRWLYRLSLASLPVVAVCARQLPESRRWIAAEDGPARGGRPGWGRRSVAPGKAIARVTRGRGRLASWVGSSLLGRLVLVCAGAVLFALFAAPAYQFQTEFLRQERHYNAFGISALQQAAGTIGALGVLFGGRLADTHGRRPVAVACVLGATATTVWSYLAHGWLMWMATRVGEFFLYATAPGARRLRGRAVRHPVPGEVGGPGGRRLVSGWRVGLLAVGASPGISARSARPSERWPSVLCCWWSCW